MNIPKEMKDRMLAYAHGMPVVEAIEAGHMGIFQDLRTDHRFGDLPSLAELLPFFNEHLMAIPPYDVVRPIFIPAQVLSSADPLASFGCIGFAQMPSSVDNG